MPKLETYNAIIERAEKLDILPEKSDKLSILMDLESADKHFNLRLEEFLNADDFNFAHDFSGIVNNIVRNEYPSKEFNCFVPRFAGEV